jgi:hypothetical protein
MPTHSLFQRNLISLSLGRARPSFFFSYIPSFDPTDESDMLVSVFVIVIDHEMLWLRRGCDPFQLGSKDAQPMHSNSEIQVYQPLLLSHPALLLRL